MLDLLILKAVPLGPLHGYGVLLRINQISKEALHYRLTPAGRKRLRDEPAGWDRLVTMIGAAMDATPEEV